MKRVVRKGRCRLCNIKTTYYDFRDDRDTVEEGIKDEELKRRIRYRGYRFICKTLHAELPLLSSMETQMFCSICEKFLTEIHKLLFDIEVCKMKLEGKIEDVKERALKVVEEGKRSAAEVYKRRRTGRGDKTGTPAEEPGTSASDFCSRLAAFDNRSLNPKVMLNRVLLPAVTVTERVKLSESTCMATDTGNLSFTSVLPEEDSEYFKLEQQEDEEADSFSISPDSPTDISVVSDEFEFDDPNFQSEDSDNASNWGFVRPRTMSEDTKGRSLRKSTRLNVLRSKKQPDSSHTSRAKSSPNNNLQSLTGSGEVERTISDSESENLSTVAYIDFDIKHMDKEDNDDASSEEDPLYIPSDEEIEEDSSSETGDGRASPLPMHDKHSKIKKNGRSKEIKNMPAPNIVNPKPQNKSLHAQVAGIPNDQRGGPILPSITLALPPEQLGNVVVPSSSTPSPRNIIRLNVNSDGRVGIPQKIYRCDYCDAVFIAKSLVVDHYDQLHAEKPKFQCTKCERKFYLSSDLQLHLERDHQPPVPKADAPTGNNLVRIIVLPETGSTQREEVTTTILKILALKEDEKLMDKIEEDVQKMMGDINVKRISPKEHKCPLCSTILDTKMELNHHLLSAHETEDKPHRCNLCSESFTQKINLENHNIRCRLGCTLCGRSFTGQENLDEHLATDHNNEEENLRKKFKCTKCEKKFFRISLLKKHIKQVHANAFCDQCGKKFKSVRRFKEHMLWHVKKDSFKCTQCEKTFASTSSLHYHIKRLHLHVKQKEASASKDFVCDVCGKAFYKEPALKHHLRIHDETLKATFLPCPVCSKQVPKISLQSHVRNHAAAKLKVTCDICGMEMTKSNFYIHRRKIKCKSRRATNSDPASFNTGDTGSINASNTSPSSSDTVKEVESMPKDVVDSSHESKLNSSNQTDQGLDAIPISQSEGNSQNNSKCLATNSSEPAVLREKKKIRKYPIYSISTGKYRRSNALNIPYSEDDYKCWKCGKLYETDVEMENHFKETHDGSRPFKCPYDSCKSSSWRRSDLRVHKYFMHMTEEEKKPFQTLQCNLCDKRFGYFEGNRFKTHMMDHNNERPFACPKCNFGFKTARVLRQHIRTHEKKVVGKCTICGKEFTRICSLQKHNLEQHTGSFSCHICTVRKPTEKEMQKHLDFHKRRFEWVEPKEGQVTNQSEQAT